MEQNYVTVTLCIHGIFMYLCSLLSVFRTLCLKNGRILFLERFSLESPDLKNNFGLQIYDVIRLSLLSLKLPRAHFKM